MNPKWRVPREAGSKLEAAFRSLRATAEILSHDPKTQVGAAILDQRTFRILATSVNGFISGAWDEYLPNVSPHKHDYMRHAERNLKSFCASEGIAMKDKIVISTHSPCYDCARELWDVGIKFVIFEIEHKQTRENFEGKLDLAYSIETLDCMHEVVDTTMFTNEDWERYKAMKLDIVKPKEIEKILKENSWNC